MDINLCIHHLELNSNSYRLNQNNTPHEITHWYGPDAQPAQAVLESAWAEIEDDANYQKYLADPTNNLYPV